MRPDMHPEPRTEEELLDREEHRAKLGLRIALENLGEEALDAADLRRRVEQHPFLALGLGALGGFLVARPLAGAAGKLAGSGLLGTLLSLGTRLGTVGGLVATALDSERGKIERKLFR
jgi:hypothetical protein